MKLAKNQVRMKKEFVKWGGKSKLKVERLSDMMQVKFN